jgi:hypothetical protein
MVEVIRQRPMSILHPYMIEAYITRDGSETYLSLTSSKAFLRAGRRREGCHG